MATTAMPTEQPTVAPTPGGDDVFKQHPSQILPWALNPPDELHERAAYELVYLWRQDPAIAAEMARIPWIADGIEEGDLLPLQNVAGIKFASPELEERLLPHLQHGYSREMIGPLVLFLNNGEESAIRLLDLPWFADGLNREETAFLTPVMRLLGDESTYDALFTGLLQTHYTQSRMVSLPLAGDTCIYVFSNEPFNQEQDLTLVIAEAAFVTEGFIGESFPDEDIILLALKGDDFRHLGRARHLGDHMRVVDRWGNTHFSDSSIRHETAHYYFDGSIGPVWLSEGTANFMESYIYVWPSESRLESYRRSAERATDDCNSAKGIENIVELNRVYNDYPPAWECAYHMGENFLHQMYHALGKATVGSALGDLYRLTQSRESSATEAEIYRVFLENAPPGREEAFRDIYERYHGGEYGQ